MPPGSAPQISSGSAGVIRAPERNAFPSVGRDRVPASRVADLVAAIRRDPRCVVHAPVGPAALPTGFELPPPGLAEFYELCGGIDLFLSADCGARIVPPAGLARANLEILGAELPEDRSHAWFVLARDAAEPIAVIDLHPERLGRCYDSFHETYGLVGDMNVVARDFGGLLSHLLAAGGTYWYWLKDDWDRLGDAYDD